MVLFTTGRGTPFGTFVPTMKISTNSTLAKNKPGWIDFNAGVIVENEPMEKTCERFIDYIIKVASGEFVNNEKKGYREIAIFKTDVVLEAAGGKDTFALAGKCARPNGLVTVVAARLDNRRARPGGAVNGGALVRRSSRPLTAPTGFAIQQFAARKSAPQ